MKMRLDAVLVMRGLAASRQKAQALILAGEVLVNDSPGVKAGMMIDLDAEVRLKAGYIQYVSRGAFKLIGALDDFKVSVDAKRALDIGASTGGFTEVLLERGAFQVIAVDVGHDQMNWKIKSDPRVKLIEKTNARYLSFSDIGTTVDIITVDVSFISLKIILPALIQFSTLETDWITLIKPQFEVGPENIEKGGIVKSEAVRNQAVNGIVEFGKTLGLESLSLIQSPIQGTQGNVEYLAHWRRAK
jgi:23S rRNA (cytidine1920-2'-O)/16S rRNA (cytidine1409-2'-O)-methyltransferase